MVSRTYRERFFMDERNCDRKRRYGKDLVVTNCNCHVIRHRAETIQIRRQAKIGILLLRFMPIICKTLELKALEL